MAGLWCDSPGRLGPSLRIQWKPNQLRASGSAPILVGYKLKTQEGGNTTLGPPANGRCLDACSWGRWLSKQGYRGQTFKWTGGPADQLKPTSKLHRVPEGKCWSPTMKILGLCSQACGRCDYPGMGLGCASRSSPTTSLALTPPANLSENTMLLFRFPFLLQLWSGTGSR